MTNFYTDLFRPSNEPARSIYDALTKEAEKRKDKDCEEWIDTERKVVWAVVRDYAQQHNLKVPTIEDIERAENYALGHCDYAAKFAYKVTDLLYNRKSVGEES